jgi:hypothetical protein
MAVDIGHGGDKRLRLGPFDVSVSCHHDEDGDELMS